jgi:hypothetical protein
LNDLNGLACGANVVHVVKKPQLIDNQLRFHIVSGTTKNRPEASGRGTRIFSLSVLKEFGLVFDCPRLLIQ